MNRDELDKDTNKKVNEILPLVTKLKEEHASLTATNTELSKRVKELEGTCKKWGVSPIKNDPMYVVSLHKEINGLNDKLKAVEEALQKSKTYNMHIDEALTILNPPDRGDGIHTTKDFGCNRCGYQRCACGGQ